MTASSCLVCSTAPSTANYSSPMSSSSSPQLWHPMTSSSPITSAATRLPVSARPSRRVVPHCTFCRHTLPTSTRSVNGRRTLVLPHMWCFLGLYIVRQSERHRGVAAAHGGRAYAFTSDGFCSRSPLGATDPARVSDHIAIEAKPRSTKAACPDCGTFSRRVHSYRQRVLRDLPWQGRPVLILLPVAALPEIESPLMKRSAV